MNKNEQKKYSSFSRTMNETDIKNMYKANEDFVIPEELRELIKALADK